MLNNYICALDIGSSKISAVLARIKKGRISELYFESGVSKGMKKGGVVNSIELTGCIGKLLKNLKEKSGTNIKVVNANISGENIITKHSRAILPLAERGNKVITLSDIHKVNEQARILGSDLEEEIIHQIPYSYSVDTKTNIRNPLGLYCHRLEVDLYLISAKLSLVQSLSRAVAQAGFEVKKLIFSGLATKSAVFNEELKEGWNVFCDIGSDITEILIFKDGLLRSVEILSLGGENLTLAIQEELHIPLDLAEEVKKAHSSIGDFSSIDENKEILIKKENSYKPIKQRLVSQILTSQANALALNIKAEIEKHLHCTEINNFCIAGRALLLEGFIEMLEGNLGVPVKIGRIWNPVLSEIANKEESLSGQKYLNFITALGIVAESLKGDEAYFTAPKQIPRNLFLKAVNRAKEVYQEYF